MLHESEIQFEVLQEYSPGARAERIVLGHVKLNLAEYCANGSDERDDVGDGEGLRDDDGGGKGVVRRYLMRESKINSTLKVSHGTIQLSRSDCFNQFVAPSNAHTSRLASTCIH